MTTRRRAFAIVALAAVTALTALLAVALRQVDTPEGGPAQRAERGPHFIAQPEVRAPSGKIRPHVVPNTNHAPEVTYVEASDLASLPELTFTVIPRRKDKARIVEKRAEAARNAVPLGTPGSGSPQRYEAPAAPDAVGFANTWESWAIANTGSIPPDPHVAVGPDHVVDVVNLAYAIYTDTGGLLESDTLANFFGGLVDGGLADPRVIYDQFEDRFVLILLEIGPGTNAKILFGVSDDGDPIGNWNVTEIDSNVAFPAEGPLPAEGSFSDYPAIGLDDQAVYITTNQFGNASGEFREGRIFVVDKGVGSGGIYDGGGASTTILDPPDFDEDPTVNFALSPAHVFGTHPDASLGTYVTLFNGLNDGTNVYLRIYALTDPLTAPTITSQFMSFGPVDDPGSPVPEAPQLSGAAPLDTFPRVVMSNSAWRDGFLYLTTTLNPPSGPDAGEATAHWIQLEATTLGAALLADSGNIGAEDVAADTHTFFPSVVASAGGAVGFSFAMSGPNIHPGAGFTFRTPIDPAGTVQPTETLRAGLASYENLADGINRWGDYSGVAIDPGTDCFWVYNEYANGLNTWGTAVGEHCPAFCGNSEVEPGETCDPPGAPAGQPDECRPNCTFCGDALVQAVEGEQCDDGNNVGGDGCSPTCAFEACGNIVVDAQETCDPPGSVPADPDHACRADCTFCGDGSVNGDGNIVLNGGFDLGTLDGWTVDTQNAGSFFIDAPGTTTPESGNPTAPNALGGLFYAVADELGAGTHALSQTITIPADATSAVLDFQMFANNWNAGGTFVASAGLDDTTPNPNQHARVDLLNPGFGPFDTSPDAVVRNVYLGADPLSPPANPYTTYNVDISADVAPGQSYVLRFADTGNRGFFNLGVDNVSVTVNTSEGCDDGNNDPDDGCQSFCRPCPVGPFGQTVRASSKTEFAWPTPADISFVHGDLADISSWLFTASGTELYRTTFSAPETPAAYVGLYWLFRFDCPGADWTSGGPAEFGNRDALLP
jgi:cysteine-rich repeat protein